MSRDGFESALLPTPWRGLFVKEDFAPRAQFSASQLSTWDDCPYAWGLRYLLGIRRPEPVWGDPNLDSRDRSLAFGKALHSRLEDYFNGKPVDWTDEVGQRAIVGLHLLPQQGPLVTEQPLSFDSNRLIAMDRPVAFVGFKDLVTPAVTYDYKTTSQLTGRYARTAADLIDDPAANIYALDDMDRLGLASRAMRWVYFASKGKPEARPVDFTITRERAKPIVRMMVIQGAGLRDEIAQFRERPSDEFSAIAHLTKKTTNCQKYGGCSFHHSAGGPCRAELDSLNKPTLQYSAGLFSGVSEEGTNPMPNADGSPTIAERLAAAQAAARSAAPAAPQHAVPAPAPAPSAANPFNPASYAFAPTAPPQAPAANPFGAPQAPAAPPFGGFGTSMPASPAQIQTTIVPPSASNPFSGSPVTQVVANPGPASVAPNPFAINSPEQSFVAPPGAPPMPAAEPAKRGRKPKAQPAQPAPAAAPAPLAELPHDSFGLPVDATGGLIMVTIKLTTEDGFVIETPAPAELAEQLIATVFQSAKALLG